MNRFLSFAGQQPVYLGDFDFMQDASKSMLTCVARALMNNGSDTLNAILQGANIRYSIDGTSIIWDPGVVVLDGEILPLKSGSATATTSTPLYFHIVEERSGSRVFKDGVSHDCWSTRYAIINLVESGGILVSSVERLHEDSQAEQDVIYTGTTQSSQIVSGKLIRKKGGLWFCDVLLYLAENTYNSFGQVQFSGLPAEHLAELATKIFPYVTPLYSSHYDSDTETWGNYSWEAQPIQLGFTAASGDSFSMAIGPYNQNVRFSQTGRINELLLNY